MRPDACWYPGTACPSVVHAAVAGRSAVSEALLRVISLEIERGGRLSPGFRSGRPGFAVSEPDGSSGDIRHAIWERARFICNFAGAAGSGS